MFGNPALCCCCCCCCLLNISTDVRAKKTERERTCVKLLGERDDDEEKGE
jgi:hypothetical protein